MGANGLHGDDCALRQKGADWFIGVLTTAIRRKIQMPKGELLQFFKLYRLGPTFIFKDGNWALSNICRIKTIAHSAILRNNNEFKKSIQDEDV